MFLVVIRVELKGDIYFLPLFPVYFKHRYVLLTEQEKLSILSKIKDIVRHKKDKQCVIPCI